MVAEAEATAEVEAALVAEAAPPRPRSCESASCFLSPAATCAWRAMAAGRRAARAERCRPHRRRRRRRLLRRRRQPSLSCTCRRRRRRLTCGRRLRRIERSGWRSCVALSLRSGSVLTPSLLRRRRRMRPAPRCGGWRTSTLGGGWPRRAALWCRATSHTQRRRSIARQRGGRRRRRRRRVTSRRARGWAGGPRCTSLRRRATPSPSRRCSRQARLPPEAPPRSWRR
mmetsp:Transcript_25123/g.78985  ORF Transcript_25123/g.78985 Transcript_25123/m.78985 type:complete len:227 (-) Transcript_25123:92-772(-)